VPIDPRLQLHYPLRFKAADFVSRRISAPDNEYTDHQRSGCAAHLALLWLKAHFIFRIKAADRMRAERSGCRSPPLLTDRIDYARMTEARIGFSIVTTNKAVGYPECEALNGAPACVVQQAV
jgi:hypothetical protein